ncbi:MAG: histidinol-phosphatase HisJ family protein, partial [Anaerolineae bacterium]
MADHRPTSAPAWIDMHVHSTCSVDGSSRIIDYARRAAHLGLTHVGFCEHVDLDPRDRGCHHLDLQTYDREMVAGRAVSAAVQLCQGIEMTYQSSLEKEIHGWLTERSWEYVVLSVHLVDYVDGWAIVSEPEAMADYFATHSQRQAYLPYFEELLQAVRSGLGDVLGHLDLIKRYGTIPYGSFEPTMFEDEIRAVLRAAVESGMGLEINTSGLRQTPGEPYPALTVLHWYREAGGEVLTVGSDAHHVRELGAGIAEGLDLACAAGFRALAVFGPRPVRWI